MRIFQRIQEHLAAMGFAPNQQQHNNGKFSEKQLWGIFLSGLGTSLTSANIFYVANNREEYMYSLFTLITAAGFTLSYTSFTFANDKIFDTIEMGEKMLIESKFQLF